MCGVGLTGWLAFYQVSLISHFSRRVMHLQCLSCAARSLLACYFAFLNVLLGGGGARSGVAGYMKANIHARRLPARNRLFGFLMVEARARCADASMRRTMKGDWADTRSTAGEFVINYSGFTSNLINLWKTLRSWFANLLQDATRTKRVVVAA